MRASQSSLPAYWLCRIFCVVIAGTLLLGALSKLVSPMNSLVEMPLPFLRSMQVVILVAVELILAFALITQPTRRTVSITAGLFFLFSLWMLVLLQRRAASCGCFDGLGIHRTPLLALVTNVVSLFGLLCCLRWGKLANTELFSIPLILTPTLILACVVILPQVSVTRNTKLIALLGPEIQGKDHLIKVSASCEKCQEYTSNLVARVHPNRIFAVSLVGDTQQNNKFAQQFGVPIHVVDLNTFYYIDQRLNIPTGYQILDNKLIPLP